MEYWFPLCLHFHRYLVFVCLFVWRTLTKRPANKCLLFPSRLICLAEALYHVDNFCHSLPPHLTIHFPSCWELPNKGLGFHQRKAGYDFRGSHFDSSIVGWTKINVHLKPTRQEYPSFCITVSWTLNFTKSSNIYKCFSLVWDWLREHVYAAQGSKPTSSRKWKLTVQETWMSENLKNYQVFSLCAQPRHVHQYS